MEDWSIIPKWYRILIRWTSPAWHIFLLYCAGLFIYAMAYAVWLIATEPE